MTTVKKTLSDARPKRSQQTPLPEINDFEVPPGVTTNLRHAEYIKLRILTQDTPTKCYATIFPNDKTPGKSVYTMHQRHKNYMTYINEKKKEAFDQLGITRESLVLRVLDIAAGRTGVTDALTKTEIQPEAKDMIQAVKVASDLLGIGAPQKLEQTINATVKHKTRIRELPDNE